MRGWWELIPSLKSFKEKKKVSQPSGVKWIWFISFLYWCSPHRPISFLRRSKSVDYLMWRTQCRKLLFGKRNWLIFLVAFKHQIPSSISWGRRRKKGTGSQISSYQNKMYVHSVAGSVCSDATQGSQVKIVKLPQFKDMDSCQLSGFLQI